MEQLNHINITQLWGVIEEDDGDQLCLMLAYQERGSLMEWDGDTLKYKSRCYSTPSVNGGIDEAILRPIFAGLVQALLYCTSFIQTSYISCSLLTSAML
jgi:serine/threonine protein kinase